MGCGKSCIGKHGLPVGLLRGHAAQWVVDDLAVGVAKVYVGQAVHLVVVEGLLKVTEVVLSGLKITKFIVTKISSGNDYSIVGAEKMILFRLFSATKVSKNSSNSRYQFVSKFIESSSQYEVKPVLAEYTKI